MNHLRQQQPLMKPPPVLVLPSPLSKTPQVQMPNSTVSAQKSVSLQRTRSKSVCSTEPPCALRQKEQEQTQFVQGLLLENQETSMALAMKEQEEEEKGKKSHRRHHRHHHSSNSKHSKSTSPNLNLPLDSEHKNEPSPSATNNLLTISDTLQQLPPSPSNETPKIHKPLPIPPPQNQQQTTAVQVSRQLPIPPPQINQQQRQLPIRPLPPPTKRNPQQQQQQQASTFRRVLPIFPTVSQHQRTSSEQIPTQKTENEQAQIPVVKVKQQWISAQLSVQQQQQPPPPPISQQQQNQTEVVKQRTISAWIPAQISESSEKQQQAEQQQQQPIPVANATSENQPQQEQEEPSEINNKDGSALWIATISEKLEEVIQIVNRNKNAIDWNSNEFGYTSLFAASQMGFKSIVEALLKAGANQNWIYKTGATPLFVACEFGRSEIAELLLKSGSEPNISLVEDNTSPMYIACEKGHKLIVETLLKVGGSAIDKDKALTTDGMTPLMIASKKGFCDIVEILIKAGVDKEKVSNGKNSALHIAVQSGMKLVVDILLKSGVDKNKQNSEGKTALVIAIDKGFMDIAELIASFGGTIPLFWMNTIESKIGKEKLASLISSATNLPPSPTNPPLQQQPNQTNSSSSNSLKITTPKIPRESASIDDVCNWLDQIGLKDYIQAFKENEIDGNSLLSLTEKDLIEMKITKIGHKKTILSAIEKAKSSTIVISRSENVHEFNSLAKTILPDSRQAEIAKREQELAATYIRKTWEEMPVAVDPKEKINFGLGFSQASINQELVQILTVTNKTENKVNVRFLVTPSSNYKLEFIPPELKIGREKQEKVVMKLTAFCTTLLNLEIPVICWEGGKTETCAAQITTEVDTKLSTKLDSNELKIEETPIGDGASGIVYHGKFRRLEVAIKVLKNQQVITAIEKQDFFSEVEMLEKLRNPFIINFIGAIYTPGKLAIVTEFCPFGNLGNAVEKYQFSLALKLKALLDAAHGMDYLHECGILHRDLKPGNLLVVSLEVKSNVVCKLSDFGTTRNVNRFVRSMETIHGAVGTQCFMAPEIMKGSKTYEKSTDVYSFGMTMVNVVNEKVPLEEENANISHFDFTKMIIDGKRPTFITPIPSELKRLISHCWDGEPAARPAFATIVTALEEIFENEIN